MLVPLLDAPAESLGGKGAGLRRLAAHGLPVPRTAVLPVEAFDAFLRHNGLRGDEPDAAGRILAGEIPFALEAVAPRMAVRSSGVGEDGREHSWAGQFATVLGVDRDGLPDAVKRCWASAVSARAEAYRAHAHAGRAGMAVLVQEMVDARASGVMFTINPLTGSWREMTVEAVWGLGEPLVSGHAVPDRYLLSRPRRTPRPVQRVLAHARLVVEDETVARQDRETVLGRGGIAEQPCAAPLARKLPRAELYALARLGLRVEGRMRGPQDIEWAQDRAGHFWVLQARPVTTRAELPRGGETLWTRRFVGERWPDGCTPMGWSIVSPVLDWFVAYPETSARYLGGDPPLRVVRGHPYLNVTVFRHLAFKLPGAPPPRFMLDFFPPEEEARWLRRAAAPPDLRVYASILSTTFAEKRWRRFRWNPLTNHRAWEAFRGGLEPRLEALEAAPPEAAIAVADDLVRDYVKIHITSLLFANLYYQLVEPLLPAEDRPLLLRAPAGTVTARVNHELWLLGRDPSRLPDFLARHGHRSSASWEVFSRRWAEDPDGVLRLAATLRDKADPAPPGEDPAVEAARARLDPFLREAVRLTQTYLRLREEQRYHLDRVLYALKRKLLALGARWFDESDAIRFLTRDELALPVDELRRIAARRAEEPVEPDPPDFLRGDQAVPVPAHGARRLQGLGISPGVVSGRTRVLRRPEDGTRLRPGEILVARATDPGWTPLFLTAGGLVLELGSLLSHGAVVAREYRVPGVVNVRGACQLLADGTEVTLDGRAGVVWIHG